MIIDNNIPFCSKQLSPLRKSYYTNALTEQINKRPEDIQNLYKLGIDFINERINKKEYIYKMYDVVKNLYGTPSKINETESFVVQNYALFFDLFGRNQNAIKKSEIIKNIGYLV